MSVNGTYSYLATDGLGSVSEALDGNGNVTATQLYAPYGGVRYSSGTMPTAKGFTGQRADAAGGLDYYGARYYDPALGQFTSGDSDPRGGVNRYAYVQGRVETATDPTGHRYTCNQGCGDGDGPGGCQSDGSCGCYDSCGGNGNNNNNNGNSGDNGNGGSVGGCEACTTVTGSLHVASRQQASAAKAIAGDTTSALEWGLLGIGSAITGLQTLGGLLRRLGRGPLLAALIAALTTTLVIGTIVAFEFLWESSQSAGWFQHVNNVDTFGWLARESVTALSILIGGAAFAAALADPEVVAVAGGVIAGAIASVTGYIGIIQLSISKQEAELGYPNGVN